MQYFRRLIWFIAWRLVLLSILLGMLVCGFFMCMNLANVYLVLDEGMEKRAEVILTREDAEELNKYFRYDFLSADPAIAGAFDGTSTYNAYTITDFEYDLKIEKLWSWPWDNYATSTVVERIPSITGRVLSSRSDMPSEIPPWQGGRYNITLLREDGRWLIAGMQQTAILMEEESSQEDQLVR